MKTKNEMKPLNQYSTHDLHERLQGLAKNLFFSNGQLHLPADVMQAYQETHDEACTRGQLPILEVEKLIKPTDETPIIHKKCVVRYSKREHLNGLRSGIVSFGPAQSYKTMPNKAQKDDELERSWRGPNSTVTISGVQYPASNVVFNQPLKKEGGDFIHYHSLSMSMEESPKLQRAFDVDGYVLINDYKLFYDIISEGLKKKLGRDGGWGSGLIKYYDDRQPPTLETVTDFVFSKSILFLYQREARLVVFDAPSPHDRLEFEVDWPDGLISSIKSF